jgi:hypothetical protein
MYRGESGFGATNVFSAVTVASQTPLKCLSTSSTGTGHFGFGPDGMLY